MDSAQSGGENSDHRIQQEAEGVPAQARMMKALFESPMFTGCEGKAGLKRTRPGPFVFQDALYWSFLFGATSGHRLSELANALMEDVETGVGPCQPELGG